MPGKTRKILKTAEITDLRGRGRIREILKTADLAHVILADLPTQTWIKNFQGWKPMSILHANLPKRNPQSLFSAATFLPVAHLRPYMS